MDELLEWIFREERESSLGNMYELYDKGLSYFLIYLDKARDLQGL